MADKPLILLEKTDCFFFSHVAELEQFVLNPFFSGSKKTQKEGATNVTPLSFFGHLNK